MSPSDSTSSPPVAAIPPEPDPPRGSWWSRSDFRLNTHVAMDEMVLAVFRRNGLTVNEDDLPEMMVDAETALAFVERVGWVGDPGSSLLAPSAPKVVEMMPRQRSGTFRYERIRFRSEFRADPGLPGAEQWDAAARNHQVHAWLMRHDEPRPWIVCVHGTGMGKALADFGLFRANWLHETLGLNVVMPILPLHGPRRDDDDVLHYPSQHMVDNIHGTLQAVSDVRAILAWIRTQDATAPIAMHGVSLGGYVSALVASQEPELTCVLLGAPVADLEALMEGHMTEGASDEMLAYLTLCQRLSEVTSPLSHAPVAHSDRAFIYAGVVDRMVSRRRHALRLWYHWGKPTSLWFPGGHAALGRSAAVQDFVHKALRESAVLDD